MLMPIIFIAMLLYFAYIVHAVRMKILQEVIYIRTTLSLREVNLNDVKSSVQKLENIVKID